MEKEWTREQKEKWNDWDEISGKLETIQKGESCPGETETLRILRFKKIEDDRKERDEWMRSCFDYSTIVTPYQQDLIDSLWDSYWIFKRKMLAKKLEKRKEEIVDVLLESSIMDPEYLEELLIIQGLTPSSTRQLDP